VANASGRGHATTYHFTIIRQPVSLVVSVMTFKEYLATKKIDVARFAAEDPVIFDQWSRLFDQVSAESFTVQKKFLLNTTRRKYLMR
jgi:hypothetical protein